MWLHDDEIDGTCSRDMFKSKDRDYAIYATVLMEPSLRGLSKTPLIRQRTGAIDGLGFWTEKGKPEPVRRLIGNVSGLLKETVDDFVEKNREAIELEPVEMGFPYLILPESESKRLFRDIGSVEAGYRKLREEFPNAHGLITLSRVGFDPDRRQSIVALGHQFGGRCGHGYYVFLEFLDGCWLVSRSTIGWIS